MRRPNRIAAREEGRSARETARPTASAVSSAKRESTRAIRSEKTRNGDAAARAAAASEVAGATLPGSVASAVVSRQAAQASAGMSNTPQRTERSRPLRTGSEETGRNSASSHGRSEETRLN